MSQMHSPINIQHANERVLLDSRMESLVDMIYNPVKELCIDVLCQSISGICGLQLGDGLDICLRGSSQLSMAEPVTHLFVIHTHEVTEDGKWLVLGLPK